MCRDKNYFLFVFLLYLTPIYSQEYIYDITHISTDEGLPSEKVLNILQDQKGYIWVHTPEGISRYDGYEFKNYTAAQLGINVKSSLSFAFDEANNLWYCEQNSSSTTIGIFDPTIDSIYSLQNYTNGSIQSDEVISLTPSQIKPGTLCISTNKGSVYQYDSSLKKIYQNKLELSLLACHHIADESYWILDEGQAIHYQDKQENKYSLLFHPLTLIASAPKIIVEIQGPLTSYAILQDGSFGPYSPISKATKEVVKMLPETKGYSVQYSPYELQIQYKNNTTLFNPNDLIRPCNNCRLKINKALADNQSNLWLATDEGIILLTPKKKQFNLLEVGKTIESIFQWEQELWVGELTQNTRIDLSNPYRELFLKKERVKASSFAVDDEQQLWVAADNHLHVYSKEGDKVKSIRLKGNAAKSIHYDKKNQQFFIGTNIGIERLSLLADTIQVRQVDSLDTEVRQIFQNNKGLWLVTSNGLFLFDPISLEQVQHYSIADKLPTNNLYFLHEDKAGIFWIATKEEGLVKWDLENNTLQQFTTFDGLTDNTIYSIYEDAFNKLWIPSKSGLNCLDKEKDQIKRYNPADQIQFNSYAHHQSEEGLLYFGGDNGIVKINPADFSKKETTESAFNLVKIQVLKNDAERYEDRTKSILSSQIITIEPDDQVVEIVFNLLDYRNLDGKKYAYRLDKNQEQWIETKDNKINLNNLPYGNYNLQIKAKGASSEWSKQLIEIPIKVIPPLYHRLWFQVLLLSLGGFLIYLGSLWRIKALEKDKEQLEAEVQKRTWQIEKDKETILHQTEELKELDKAKTRFFSNITHEFRTPLTLIIGPTQQIINDQPKAAHQQRLNGILGNAKHLLGLINQLLDLSKIEGKQMNVAVFHGDLIAYTQELIDRFLPIAQKKKITLTNKSTRKVWKTYFDKDKWDKILINLLSNAIKFTPDKGSIQIQIKQSKQESGYFIFLEVKDSGVGIKESQLDKIFDRFYQVDGSSTRIQQGTGIGLSLVKELVELQGGKLEVFSQVNKGTTFQIYVPILSAEQVSTTKEKPHKDPVTEPIFPIEPTSTLENEGIVVTKKGARLALLIIEDNAEMRTYIRQCLDDSKYHISEAADGAEGIQKAIDTIPDLIISDVMMPNKNGFEVTQTLRETINTSHIPIVLLTAKASLESRLEGLKRGADAYLSKPFSPDELTIRVNKLIELRHLIRARYASNQLEIAHPTTDSNAFAKEDEFMESIRDFIHTHLNESQLNGEKIGKAFGMSRMQLHRKMSALTATPISELIRNIRLAKAAQLLTQHQLNISEVAYETGFNSPSHFSRIFKTTYGVSPSEFKANPVS